MRVLVSGGAGFLGSHLVDSLVARGDEVVVLDDLSRGEESQINTGARFVHGDVRLFQDWQNACLDFKPEVIHHLAAVNGTRRFHKEADLVVDVNINGTRMALKFAKEQGAKMVFYSSPEAFGDGQSKVFLKKLLREFSSSPQKNSIFRILFSPAALGGSIKSTKC